MTNVIEFRKVTKSYSISRYKYRRLSEDFGQILARIITRKKRTIQNEKFLAIKNVGFAVEEGTVLGIIGRNGAGKSTILKLISKITYPDSGEITVEGRVAPFIELGAGLHPELSGRENIYLYGAILGMKKKDIDEKFEDIVKFSGLRKFLDTPIKRYSSGMYARIGFSVVAFMDPDILLVDEVLAVGDKSFQEKCLLKMIDFAKNKKTIIFVSHNLEAIKKICKEVMFIDKGSIKAKGNPEKITQDYLASFQKSN